MRRSERLACVFLLVSGTLLHRAAGVNLYPYGESEPGESFLEAGDEGASEGVNLTVVFPFYGSTASSIYVS